MKKVNAQCAEDKRTVEKKLLKEHTSGRQNLNLALIATMIGTDAPTLSLLFRNRRKPQKTNVVGSLSARSC